LEFCFNWTSFLGCQGWMKCEAFVPIEVAWMQMHLCSFLHSAIDADYFYLVCMYCWSSVLKMWHDDYAISRWNICIWHMVFIGTFDSPNVCYTSFTWDAFHAKVSCLGILDFSEHVDDFLNSNVDSLGAIVSMQPADLLRFDIVNVERQLCLWVSYCEPVAYFSRQGFLNILMTTTNFLLTSNTYRIKVLKCLILNLKALWFFEMLVAVNSQHSKYSRWLEESTTLL